MPDKIEKLLRKLSTKERGQLKNILANIKSGQFAGTDIVKLKGQENIYRVRKGSMRIIFRKIDEDVITILTIERRSETTYNNL